MYVLSVQNVRANTLVQNNSGAIE